MIEGLVYGALKGLVANRCFPNTFEQPGNDPPVWPAIRYVVVSSTSEVDICGTDTVDTDDVRVQLDLVAKTHGAVITLRDQVITAMMALAVPARRENTQQLYDQETKTHRVTMDYLFSQSSTGSP